MPPGSLSSLQARILRVLAGMDPPWVLTGGGGALRVPFEAPQDRDLDLFWRGRGLLGDVPDLVRDRLAADGLRVDTIQRASSFHRFNVSDGSEACVVDLVADEVASVTAPETSEIAGRPLAIDSKHEILVNKLCTLLGRAEIRDLIDLRALLEAGEDLQRGLLDAPRKDGGFSPSTLAWLLRGLPIAALARSEGLGDAEAHGLESFRDDLVQQRLTLVRPAS